MTEEKRILIVDFTDYEDYPIGGYLTFARNLMESFGPVLALAGITTSVTDPVGRWFKKTIKGTEYDFFAMARYIRVQTRNVIPDRLVNYLLARYYKKRILGLGINNIFLQRHESLMAFSDRNMNICYSFPGLENPLSISKYSYAGMLAKWFERQFFRKVIHSNIILARGDNDAISAMLSRSNGTLAKRTIIKFPTRIKTGVFRPVGKDEARASLNLPDTSTIVVTTGRLAWLKGWKFMVDCFEKFSKKVADPLFIIVGEGEDYYKIKSYISEKNLADKILLQGKQSREEIALYLNASDVYIMGSYKEGWPTALMEAVACGVPACATEFSSVDEIILDGENGYIIRDRDEDIFVESMLKAMKLPRPVKNDHVIRFSTENLKNDLLKYWELT
ncbi:MAG: glycosyltransferase family 4 protein [Bacteroidales bacterium]|nr:glycosyltransferase family 4 protein [Bacteroidales bacterium]